MENIESSKIESLEKFPYGMFAIVALMDIMTYCCQKIAVENTVGAGMTFYHSLLLSPFFWAGIALGPLQLVFWIRILGKTDLSLAYPISSISSPIMVILAQFVFAEKLGWHVWLGTFLISIGTALMGFTQKSENNSN